MRIFAPFLACVALSSTAFAACPMAELIKRGEVSKELADIYHRGEGLPASLLKRTEEDIAPAARDENPNADPPPLFDPVSGVLSPIGLGSVVPRSYTPREEKKILRDVHARMQYEHIKARLEERDEDVDINARVLTPKAAKRHFEERGLLGGLLNPLQGPLQHLDVPTPQSDTGLKAIPGDDPNHQYQPPGPTDKRGNCPTLNTLANYGYLSRTGITNFAEAANAIQEAYNINFDLSVGLSALGLLTGGDIVTGKYSIGGKDSRVPDTIGPAWGIDRNGFFGVDASVSRSDWGWFGDSHTFNQTRFDRLTAQADQYGGGLYNLETFKVNAYESLVESRDTNPHFTHGANFFVDYATRALTSRPLPNGTAPNVPDKANIQPFFLEEKFPEGWYRIPNSYGFADLLADIATLFLAKPFPLGANSNGHYVPLDTQPPTASQDLGCFAFSALINVAPGQLAGAVEVAADAVRDQIFAPIFQNLGCDLHAFNSDAGSDAPYSPENADGGSGSGIPKVH